MSKLLYTDLMEYANDAAAQAAYVSSDVAAIQPASWDLLDEDCSDISDWVNDDNINAVSEVSPAGQFRLDGNTAAAANRAQIYRDFGSTPKNYTVELKLYHDSLGARADDDAFYFEVDRSDEQFRVYFNANKVEIRDGANYVEVGTDLVKEGVSAEWQTWRFLVTLTDTPGEGTCDVYLKDSTHNWEKVGTAIPCSVTNTVTDGTVYLIQYAITTNDMLTHVDYLKIYDGLQPPNLQSFSEDTIKQQGTYSLKGVAVITDSLNDTLTKTLADYLDYSIMDKIVFQVRSSRTGENLQLQIHDTGGTTSSHTINIATADTWQTETWDISGITGTDRDTIDKIIIKVINADAANTFYFDNLFSEIKMEHSYPWIGG